MAHIYGLAKENLQRALKVHNSDRQRWIDYKPPEEKLLNLRKPFTLEPEYTALDRMLFIVNMNTQINGLCLVSVVMSCMALEAFINNYSFEKLVNSAQRESLDHASLKSKWILIPKVVTGMEFRTNTRAFKLFAELIKLRNSVVHFKSKKRKKYEYEQLVSIEKAKISLQAVSGMVEELKRLDDSIDSNWIDKEWHRPRIWADEEMEMLG